MFGFGPDMIYRIPALLIALTVHEYAHARVAVWLGDHTPRTEGRLTLNPIAHLDPYGLIALWLFKFGWAKPVPINPYNFKDFRMGSLWVSLAGPGANLLTALIAAILLTLNQNINLLGGGLYNVLAETYWYNLIFAAFNLIPLPPLDGSKVLMSLSPSRFVRYFEMIEPYGAFILLGLIYLGSISNMDIIGAFTDPLMKVFKLIINFVLVLLFRM